MRAKVHRKGATVTVTIPCANVEMADDVVAAFEELWGNIDKHTASCLRGLLERGEDCSCGYGKPIIVGKFARLCRPTFELSAKGLVALLDEKERTPPKRH